MNSFAVLVASLALALPTALTGGGAPVDVRNAAEEDSAPQQAMSSAAPPFANLLQRYEPEDRNQVRIEQRVIIRVAPARRARQDLLADLPQGEIAKSFEERPMKRCVPMASVAGVQSGPQNRLILFMRDRRIVSAALEKTCSARDFYSGFYVERTKDGLFCTGRDTLKSRTGASCGVKRFATLVAVSEQASRR